METVKLGLLIKKTKVARCGEHSYPVLSITKQDGIIMQSEKFKKRIASADTSDYKIIPRGKLVQGIHIDEGNFGIQDIVDNGIVSPAYGVWDINDGLVIPKYLEMVLRSPKSIEFYRSKLTGTVNRRGHMSDADFLSMDIPLPDRDTQSKILKTMKQTTSVLYSRQQQLAKLDELIKARFVPILDCTKVAIDEKIAFRRYGGVYEPSELTFTALNDDTKTQHTVALLKEIYYGSTPQKIAEAKMLRGDVADELDKFQKSLREYQEADGEDKIDAECLISMSLKWNKPFAAFKRWVIRDHFPELIKYCQ